MPFGNYSPQDVPWPDIPIQISKQYYAMMQASLRICSDILACYIQNPYVPYQSAAGLREHDA